MRCNPSTATLRSRNTLEENAVNTHAAADRRPSADTICDDPRLRTWAMIAGASAILLAIYHVATPGSPGGAVYESLSDYFREIGFLTYLVATVVAVVAASRAGLSNRTAAGLIATGYSLIAVGVAIGLILREELDWFFLLAGPGLLLSAVGFLVFALGIWRRSSLPRWTAVLAGIGGLVAIIMTEFGSGVLIGSFWLFVASYSRSNPASPGRRLGNSSQPGGTPTSVGRDPGPVG